MHLKRQKIPRKWPIQRKGTKYVVNPLFNFRGGVPILIFLRDMLGVAKNRKEVKSALHNKNILLNDRVVRDDKHTVLLLDKVSILPSKKYYELNLSDSGKFMAQETDEKNSHHKVSKVIDKKTLKGKKVQVNLRDGRNYLFKEPVKINDSVVIDFKSKKVAKQLPLKEKANVLVFAGKHTGKKGKINKVEEDKKMVEIETKEGKVNVLIKQIMVTE